MGDAVKARLLELMIKSGALKFGDFTLKSGRKSPYFINAGAYNDGWQMTELGACYAELIRQSEVEFEVLFGPAYKAIPLAVMCASQLSTAENRVRFSFNRKEAKDHGEGGMIVGYVPQDGDRIAIIEDVTSAGTSVRETGELLTKLGIDAKIVALYISVDRMERGTGDESAIAQLKREFGIEVYSMATVADIVDYLENLPDGCTPIPDALQHAANIRGYLKEYGAAV